MKEFKNQIKRVSSAAAIVAAGAFCLGGATAWAGSKPSAPARSAPARPAAHAAAPASHAAAPASHGASSGAAGHPGGASGSASHSSGPSANGSHSSSPSANGSHGASGAAGGAHGAEGNNGHASAGSNGAHGSTAGAPHGTSASHSAISKPVPHGASDHVAKNGSAVRTRSNGRVSDVHDAKRGMDIHHGLDGGRHVEARRGDGSRLVADRGRRGFVERGYHYHGHDFARRSYYWHGHEYGRFYRGYGYYGISLNVYAPGVFFAPGFYGWAYNPWAAAVAYSAWGWGGTPWFGFYGGFFSPWAVYPGPAYWLTDYLIAANLEAAYAARQAAAADAEAAVAGAAQQVALSEDVKQQIAAEVKAQIALENQEATQTAANQEVDAGSSGVARMLSDGHTHVFVVGSGLDLTDSNGQECAVSDGDALQLRTPPAAGATSADLVVLASKGGNECASGGTVSVGVSDLQEMQNHLRETIDQGLQEMQSKQGKNGIPAAPPSAQAAPKASPYAEVAPPPNPQDEKDLQAQAQQADASESEVAKEASTDGGTPIAAPTPTASADQPAKAPVTVALGQTTDQVKAILGNPMKTADLGAKTIYYYDGMKVVFKAGKVSDVE